MPFESLTNVDRIKCPPWGVHGAGAAKPGRVTIIKAGGETEILGKAKNRPLEAGDRVILETGGGGGWGAANRRDVARIQRDFERGYITAEAVSQEYGASLVNGKVVRA